MKLIFVSFKLPIDFALGMEFFFLILIKQKFKLPLGFFVVVCRVFKIKIKANGNSPSCF